MFAAILNLPKLFSKRYTVIFFDRENMPLAGTQINIGKLTATLKDVAEEDKTAYEKVKLATENISKVTHEREDRMFQDAFDTRVVDTTNWQCRKCSTTIFITDGQVITCSDCGFREVKQ